MTPTTQVNMKGIESMRVKNVAFVESIPPNLATMKDHQRNTRLEVKAHFHEV